MLILTSIMNIPHCGGVSTHVLLLQKKLADRGIKNRLIDGKVANYQRWITALEAVIKIRDMRTLWIRRRLFLLSQKFKNINDKVHFIHAHDPIASVAAIGMKVPIITTIHGPIYEHARELGMLQKNYLETIREFELKCFKCTDFFITVDSGQKKLLIQKGVSEQKIIVIHNAVDVDYLNNLTNINKFKFEKNYFIMARRLVPKNGPQIAVDAFLKWVEGRDVRLFVVGDGFLRTIIEKKIKNHKSGNKIILMGELSPHRLLTLMKNAIASIVPSVPVEGVIEATSFSALESLALDVPVIASNIGGLAEIDDGNKIMTLVPPDNIHALAEQFNYWFERRKEDRDIIRSSYVRKNFGVEQWLEKHIQMYKKI